MKAKVYSIADGIAARQISPDLVEQNGWLKKPWTDDEINTAKSHETNGFIKSPSLSLMAPPQCKKISILHQQFLTNIKITEHS